MKPFLKTTLACGTGFIVAALVLFLISLLTINTLTTKDRTYKLKDNSVLTIELKGEISEQATEMPSISLFPARLIQPKLIKDWINCWKLFTEPRSWTRSKAFTWNQAF